MEYPPIEDHGLVGNLETCALVDGRGTVDWCCFPHLESPSVFGSILDHEDGGQFLIQPVGSFESEPRYLDRTAVLETTFRTAEGAATLTDFMPMAEGWSPDPTSPPAIARKVECTDGAVEFDVRFEPRFDYARAETTVSPTDDGAVARGNGEQLALRSTVPLDTTDGSATATTTLEAGETAWFIALYGHHERDLPGGEAMLDRTVDYWRDWVHDCGERCPVRGPWHDLVVRSELVLKLLIHHPTGAIAAAPTTSLPEQVGGVRNWDYRYSWLRDAALTVHALFKLGHADEAEHYFEWCLNLAHAGDPEELDQPIFQPLYGLHGQRDHEERVLDHLEGYRGSRPVRVGNAAADQRQLDVYGELVLGIYETTRYGESLSQPAWDAIRGVVEYVCDCWEEPDSGIWEVRTEPRQFVHSKVMCWVALDRALALAQRQGFDAPVERWQDERAAIKEAVLERGYDEERGAFVRSFGSEALDATALRMPILEFLPADDHRIGSTIDAIMDELATEEGLVYRYLAEDGLPGHEHPFLLCSFWLVEALAVAGRRERAREVFENVLGYVGPLGLFGEEIDADTGHHRGNYPQAFSHIGLINCAIYLGEAGDELLGTRAAEISGERGRSPAESP